MTTPAATPVELDYDDFVAYTELHPDGDFELRAGTIYALPPENDSHMLARVLIGRLIERRIDSERFTYYPEASFRVEGWREGPKPDGFVARGSLEANPKIRRPAAQDIRLVIEVSSSSRRKDAGKAETCAKAAIPEYWLVDLIAKLIRVHRGPRMLDGAFGYEDEHTVRPGGSLQALCVPGLTFEANDLLAYAES